MISKEFWGQFLFPGFLTVEKFALRKMKKKNIKNFQKFSKREKNVFFFSIFQRQIAPPIPVWGKNSTLPKRSFCSKKTEKRKKKIFFSREKNFF